MLRRPFALMFTAVLALAPADAIARSCAVGTSRTIEVDAKGGPIYGELTKLKTAPNLLAPKEVVLTFDDGPMPWITKAILDTLDRYCAKATFFSVGRMAAAYPATVKDIMARGHTLGTHTWSHPLSLKRLKREKAVDEIERGFAAVSAAAGQPIAPFFRFPGLNDSVELAAHLKDRNIATFTVDVVSNDSYIASPERLTRETLAKIEENRGGIVLFHDIKASTARALPQIMTELTARGYKIVHLVPRTPMKPAADLVAEVAPKISGGAKTMLPFYGAISPSAATKEEAALTEPTAKVATLNPADGEEPKIIAAKPAVKRTVPKAAKPAEPKEPRRYTAAPGYIAIRPATPVQSRPPAVLDGWATSIWTSQPPPRR